MSLLRAITALIVLTVAAVHLAPSHAEVLSVSPANPQPSDSQLSAGLAVKYAYQNVRWLREAKDWLEHKDGGTPGEALPNLGFYNEEGDPVLTSTAGQFVLANVDGYMLFPEAGTYELEFASNDGLRVHLGDNAQVIYEHDGRHPCDTLGSIQVSIDEAGWYPLKILYFQRYGSSCLWLSWRKPGDAAIAEDPVPDQFFAHTAE